jgi:hypothetical protein
MNETKKAYLSFFWVVNLTSSSVCSTRIRAPFPKSYVWLAIVLFVVNAYSSLKGRINFL